MVPAYAPTGMRRRSEFSVLKPKPLMMIGTNVEMGPGKH
jgi:hypothetical protein